MKSHGSHGNITWQTSPLIIILCHQNFEKKNIPEWRFLHLSLNISKSDHAFLGWTNNCLFVFYNQFFKHPPPLLMRSNSPQKLHRGGTTQSRAPPATREAPAVNRLPIQRLCRHLLSVPLSWQPDGVLLPI